MDCALAKYIHYETDPETTDLDTDRSQIRSPVRAGSLPFPALSHCPARSAHHIAPLQGPHLTTSRGSRSTFGPLNSAWSSSSAAIPSTLPDPFGRSPQTEQRFSFVSHSSSSGNGSPSASSSVSISQPSALHLSSPRASLVLSSPASSALRSDLSSPVSSLSPPSFALSPGPISPFCLGVNHAAASPPCSNSSSLMQQQQHCSHPLPPVVGGPLAHSPSPLPLCPPVHAAAVPSPSDSASPLSALPLPHSSLHPLPSSRLSSCHSPPVHHNITNNSQSAEAHPSATTPLTGRSFFPKLPPLSSAASPSPSSSSSSHDPSTFLSSSSAPVASSSSSTQFPSGKASSSVDSSPDSCAPLQSNTNNNTSFSPSSTTTNNSNNNIPALPLKRKSTITLPQLVPAAALSPPITASSSNSLHNPQGAPSSTSVAALALLYLVKDLLPGTAGMKLPVRVHLLLLLCSCFGRFLILVFCFFL